MKNCLILLGSLMSIFLLANAKPFIESEELAQQVLANLNSKGDYDLLLALLPIYGGIKLSNMIKPRSLDQIKRFFVANPNIYQTFQTELRNEGVNLPELENLNINAITQEDYNLLISIIGASTTIKDVMEPGYVDNLYQSIITNQTLMDLYYLRVEQCGVILSDNVDSTSVLATLEAVFVPIIPAFIPTAINIVLFGKRATPEESIQLFLQQNVLFFNQVTVFLAANGLNIQELTQAVLNGNIAAINEQVITKLLTLLVEFAQQNPNYANQVVQLISLIAGQPLPL